MPLTFHIPAALREFTGGNAVVEISSSSAVVGDALRDLCAQYPGIRDRIATEQWEMRPHINVFVGDENIRFTGGLATRIKDGAKISIVPAISGGSPPANLAINEDTDRLHARHERSCFGCLRTSVLL